MSRKRRRSVPFKFRVDGAGRPRVEPRDQQPNRIAYWVAVQVLLPNGSLALVSEEVVSARPIHTAEQLREVERQVAATFRREAPGGLPVVGGRGPEAHVMNFQVLRAWYESPAEKPAQGGTDASGQV